MRPSERNKMIRLAGLGVMLGTLFGMGIANMYIQEADSVPTAYTCPCFPVVDE